MLGNCVFPFSLFLFLQFACQWCSVADVFFFFKDIYSHVIAESRPQNGSRCTGIPFAAVVGLHDQNQVWEQHRNTRVKKQFDPVAVFQMMHCHFKRFEAVPLFAVCCLCGTVHTLMSSLHQKSFLLTFFPILEKCKPSLAYANTLLPNLTFASIARSYGD